MIQPHQVWLAIEPVDMRLGQLGAIGVMGAIGVRPRFEVTRSRSHNTAGNWAQTQNAFHLCEFDERRRLRATAPTSPRPANIMA
jgi:hypothetical protein